MKIRSITCFVNPCWPMNEKALDVAGIFVAQARAVYENAGYEVQTTRMATTPFSKLVHPLDPDAVIRFAQGVEGAARTRGFDYTSLGPALPEHPESYRFVPEALAATQNVFFSGMMTSPEGVCPSAVRACADVIYHSALITPNGFSNLRFAAIANVPAGTPFFPAAFHNADQPAFALAMESADLAIEAFCTSPDLPTARRVLIEALEQHGRALSSIADRLMQDTGVVWGGIDFSLAPFPTDEQSLGGAFERLGIPAVGLHGSLAAAAIIADTLDRARFSRAGFNGLMLPVLEDSVLAARAAEGTFSVMELLLYSTVCGIGLDTVPLPGDVTPDELYAVLLDVAVLALRLNKPLTARLMPIPGKKAGDPTNFDFSYFANSRVMPLRAAPLTRHLAENHTIPLKARNP